VRPSGTPLKTDGQQTWSALTPRVALRYSFNSDTNIYASWSRGFKSGIYNGTAFSNVPVNPETVDAYEVGFKYGSGSTSISIAGFHYDYKDIQVQILTNGSSGPTSVTTNAAGARIDGAEAQISYHLARGLSANIGVALTSARYTSFPAALTYIPKATAALCGVNPIPCGNVSQPTDVSGNQIVRTPKFTANFGIDYSVPLAGGKLAANANLYYNGGYYWDVSNRLRQGQYEVLNASIGWSPDRAHWKFSVWGRNLTNQAYSFYEASTTAGDFRSFAAPRSIGVKAEYSF
jgi:iron complex outermembrane receptor protein